MRRLYVLAVKEVKELIRDRYVLFSVILAPLLVLPLLTGVFYLAVREAGGALEEAIRELPGNVAVVLEDPGDEMAVEVARRLGARVEASIEEAVARYPTVVVLHSDFTKNILEGKPAVVTITSRVERPYSLVEVTVVTSLAQGLRDVVSIVLMEKFNVDPRLIRTPVIVESKVLYRGELLEGARLAQLYVLNLALAFIIFILGVIALQVGTLSMGIERESRTLELLLMLPISRVELIAGKVLGVSTISLMGFASFLVGLSITILLAPVLFAEGFEGIQQPQTTMRLSPIELIEALRTTSVTSVVAVVASIAVAMISTTIVGILVGVLLAGDIRGALVSGSYVALILAIPLMVEMMGLSLPTPLQIAFITSPMYPPFKTAQMIVFGETGLAVAYAIATLINVTILLAITVLMVKSERLIHGIRLRKPRVET
ncbi:MAG: ABC transporter permease subunit [Acidilobaceae archaeon]